MSNDREAMLIEADRLIIEQSVKMYLMGYLNSIQIHRCGECNTIQIFTVDELQDFVIQAMENLAGLQIIELHEKLSMGLEIVQDSEFVDLFCSSREQDSFRQENGAQKTVLIN